MKEVDIVISINVHEKIDFLIKQLQNIDEYIHYNYIVIINPNKYMYNEITNNEYIKKLNNVIINNDYLEKKRYHGSILKGIYLNMKYSMKDYNYKYFIVLSSRNLFYNKLNIDILNINKHKYTINELKKYCSYVVGDKRRPRYYKIKADSIWNNMKDSLFFKYIVSKNLPFYTSEHEGLTLDFISTNYIINFLDNNSDMRDEIFNLSCACEEIILQTIANIKYHNYNIGNGVNTNNDIKKLPKEKYVYKTVRI